MTWSSDGTLWVSLTDLVIQKVISNQNDSTIASSALRHHLCELCCMLEQLVKCQGARYIAQKSQDRITWLGHQKLQIQQCLQAQDVACWWTVARLNFSRDIPDVQAELRMQLQFLSGREQLSA